MNIRHLSIVAAALFAVSTVPAKSKPADGPEYKFTTIKENPVTSIKNQYRSGTCWCFSALSFIESEILREKGDTVDLSEMFVVGKSYRSNTHKSYLFFKKAL